MGITQDLNVARTARNPGGPFRVMVHDDRFPVVGLDSDEANLLEQQLNDLIADIDSEVMFQILKQREDTIARTAAFAKQVFDEKLFGGINAGDNEIGFSVLRPGHIRADPANGNAINDWYFSPGTTGWVDWIGDGTSANNFTFTEDQVSVILAFVDQEPTTEVSAFNVDSFGRNMDMLPHDMNDVRLRDNDTEQNVTSLPTLIGQENDEVHVRLRYDRDVETQPRLFGFTFGIGSFLNAEDF